MPNKDSFTFSDKLRKSKSLPLSKRIPSRIGGDGKAKRTLIQRAQRDLPFIIVAAAALLLLPILSRDTGSEYDGYGSGTSYTDFVPGDGSSLGAIGLGSDQDLSPVSGFRDPLSLIKRHSGEESPAIVEDRDGYNWSDDSSQSAAPVVEKVSAPYRPAARQSIRKAVSRPSTQLNRLSQGKNMAGGDRSSVVRNLAIGAAGRSSGGSSVPEQSRRMALSPSDGIKSAGRSMTGEGLYAEAARSLAAMNRGSGKQALFDAQLRNVDGTPLGVSGGAAGMGPGGVRGGGGGAPNDKFAYSPKTPWWWDFEKMKLMEKWKNWEGRLDKTLSDITFKIGTGLAYCLTTGSEDGSVKHLLGKKAGDDSSVCMKGGKQIMRPFEDLAGIGVNTNKDGDVSGSAAVTYDSYEASCKAKGGTVEVDTANAKTWYQMRMECLGLKVKKGQKRSVDEVNDCGGVYGPNKTFRIESNKKSDKGTFGIFVSVDSANPVKRDNGVMLAPEGPSKSAIGLIQAGDTWKGGETLTINGKEYYITGISGFSVNHESTGVLKDHKNKNCSKIEILQDKKRQEGISDSELAKINAEIEKTQAKCDDELAKSSSADPEVNKKILSQINADIVRMEASGEFLTEAQLGERMKRHGGLFNIQWTGFNIIRTCPTSDFRGLAMKPLTHQRADGSTATITCDGNPVSLASDNNINPGKLYRFSAKISGKLPSGSIIHAVRMEKATAGKDEGNYVVREVTQVSRRDGDTYYITGDPGQKESSDPRVKAINGHGYVYWIITKPGVEVIASVNQRIGSFGDPNSIVGKLLSTPNAYVNICEYAWGCNDDDCDSKKVERTDNFCVAEDGKVYFSSVSDPTRSNGVLLDNVHKYLEDSKQDCTPDGEARWIAALPKCVKDIAVNKRDICKDGSRLFRANASGDKAGQALSEDAIKEVIAGNKGVEVSTLTPEAIKMYIELDVPACNKAPEQPKSLTVKLGGGDKCKIRPIMQNFNACSNSLSSANYNAVAAQLREDISRCLAEKTEGDIGLAIEGHTSSDGGAVNATLSDARAIAVAEILKDVLKGSSGLMPNVTLRYNYTPRTGAAHCQGIQNKVAAFQSDVVSPTNSAYRSTIDNARSAGDAADAIVNSPELLELQSRLTSLRKEALASASASVTIADEDNRDVSLPIAEALTTLNKKLAKANSSGASIQSIRNIRTSIRSVEGQARSYYQGIIPNSQTDATPDGVTYATAIADVEAQINKITSSAQYSKAEADLLAANEAARTVNIAIKGYAFDNPVVQPPSSPKNRRVLLCLSDNGEKCAE